MALKRKPSYPVDALCVAEACRGVRTDLLCSCKQWAEHYAVPLDVVFAIVADQFIFERSGIPRLEAEYFAQMANDMLTEELIGFYKETKARLVAKLAETETRLASLCATPNGNLADHK